MLLYNLTFDILKTIELTFYVICPENIACGPNNISC